ncbi:MAG: transposase [Blastocatellia bacterium]
MVWAIWLILTEGSVNSEFVIHCFDDYCAQLTKHCLILIDNAPMPRSAAFQAKLKEWEEDGMSLLFLPPYCPELDLIEILWQKLKYEWLALSAYESFKQLSETLEETLKEAGTIDFKKMFCPRSRTNLKPFNRMHRIFFQD